MAKHKKRRRATIGIDIGGTKSLYALFDENFEVLAEEKLPTDPGEGGIEAFDGGLRKSVKKLVKECKRRGYKLAAAGAGVAGVVNMRKGTIRAAANLKFLEGYELRKTVRRIVDAPVFLVNDVQAGIYGELHLGAARKARHVIGVFIGTGVGGALVIDRRLHFGAECIAGNIGNYLLHAVHHDEGARKEVLDAVASRSAIAGDAAALAAKRQAPRLAKAAGTDVRDIKSGDIAEAIAKGDKAIENLVRSRAGVVGVALSNLVDFINPDMIVLGGGIVEAMPELMRSEVEQTVHAHAEKRASAGVKVVTAKLMNHAGTAGAAKFALDMLSRDPPIDLD